MRNYFDALSNFLSRVSAVAGQAIIAIMVLLITVDVLSRNIILKSILIATEVSGYALVALAFLGLAYTERTGSNIKISILTKRFSPSVQKKLQLVVSIVSTIFMAWLTWITLGPVIDNFNNKVTSITILHVPMWILYISIPIGYAMLTVLMTNEVVNGGYKSLETDDSV
ncbi:MAG TPA: TRAP transporter small permease [Candidatus Atribacteria bacterium]|nr:TRAP transporter small permease [Candidatus Atribacteria bacterium]